MPDPIYGPHEEGCPWYETEVCSCSARGPFGPAIPAAALWFTDTGDAVSYEFRVPGPDDLWMLIQHGGEQNNGTAAGYGSSVLTGLIAMLRDGLKQLEQQEATIARERARREDKTDPDRQVTPADGEG